MTETEFKLFGLFVNPVSRTHVVVLKNKDNTALPIHIGAFVAEFVVMYMNGAKPPRPLTYELSLKFLDGFSMKVGKASIARVVENVIYAELHIIKEDGTSVALDARPSDAINIALRAGAPIMVSDDVVRTEGINLTEDCGEFNIDEFLKRLDPKDFRYKM
jgi:hypothetical protein